MKAALAFAALAALGVLTLAALMQALRMMLAMRDARQTDAAYDAERTRLTDERDRLLNHLREVQFDFQTGKLDAKDFQQLSDRYAAQAAAVLDALEVSDASGAKVTEVRLAS